MVCKKCGADLKPGVKYCLNCGSYLEDMNDSDLDELENIDEDLNGSSDGIAGMDEKDLDNNIKSDEEYKADDVNKDDEKKGLFSKLNLSLKDLLIYGGLLLVLLISIIVIVVQLNNRKKVEKPIVSNTVDKNVKISNYTITISKSLNYSKEGNVIYITDNKNFSFSYRTQEDDYKKYKDNLNILSEDLKSRNYEVLNTDVKNSGTDEFLIYEYKSVNDVKHLYLTGIKDKYVCMGVIDELDGGDWTKSLSVISEINKSIKFEEKDDEKTDNTANNSLSDIKSILK